MCEHQPTRAGQCVVGQTANMPCTGRQLVSRQCAPNRAAPAGASRPPLQALTNHGLLVDHTYTDIKIALGLGW